MSSGVPMRVDSSNDIHRTTMFIRQLAYAFVYFDNLICELCLRDNSRTFLLSIVTFYMLILFFNMTVHVQPSMVVVVCCVLNKYGKRNQFCGIAMLNKIIN